MQGGLLARGALAGGDETLDGGSQPFYPSSCGVWGLLAIAIFPEKMTGPPLTSGASYAKISG